MREWIGTPPLLLLALAVMPVCLPGCSPAPDPRADLPSFEEFQSRIMESGVFSGGPDEWFEEVGRLTLASCIENGLMPDHRVLDIGAGSLRIGWWLVHYVEPRNYHAIEPVRDRLDTAAEILGVPIHLYYNTNFDFPDVEFDFVLARSIWTHASKPMISKMLAEFTRKSAPRARFLTSVIYAATPDEDYDGVEWVGKVLKNDPSGGVKHSRDWIRAECAKHDLSVEEVGDLHGQTWLRIERGPGDSRPAPEGSRERESR